MQKITQITARWTVLTMVLAALLVLLPAEQASAQAEKERAGSVQQTAPTNSAASLLRVPPLTESSARLLGTPPDGVLSSSDGDPLPPVLRLSRRTKEIVAMSLIAAIIILGVAGVLSYPGPDPP